MSALAELRLPPGRPASSPRPAAAHPRGVRRLLAAFAFVEALPVLGESRTRAAAALLRGGPMLRNDLATVVERDVTACIAVHRAAATARPRRSRHALDVLGAIDVLGAEQVVALIRARPAYSAVEAQPTLGFGLEHQRVHAMDVHAIATALVRIVGHPDPAAVATAALLHDIGKLAMAHCYPGYPAGVHAPGMTPQERAEAERRKFGLDHATLGGVLVRRWGLPPIVAEIVSSHHSDAPCAVLRLADTMAHHRQAQTVTEQELTSCCAAAGLDVGQMEMVLYNQTCDAPRSALRAPPSSPLSRKEHIVVAEIASGKSYKAIALGLGLTVSTIRTHLHNIYGKLGVTDRTQAVLHAVREGWIDAPQLRDAIARSGDPGGLS